MVKVDDDLPLDKAVLVGCGVPTGWGSAVNTANVQAGETVAGLRHRRHRHQRGAGRAATPGAKNVIAVDPLENKREKAMELGATHAFAHGGGGAGEPITELTRGQMADSAILTPGLMTAEIVAERVQRGRQGRHRRADRAEQDRGADHPAARLDPDAVPQDGEGQLFGDCNPTTDIPKILGLYQSGDIKLDEIITRTYTLDQVNEGYDDLLAGKNMRGVVVHEHSAA